MNEQENTRLVQQFYQSMKAGDIQSRLNSLARATRALRSIGIKKESKQ